MWKQISRAVLLAVMVPQLAWAAPVVMEQAPTGGPIVSNAPHPAAGQPKRVWPPKNIQPKPVVPETEIQPAVPKVEAPKSVTPAAPKVAPVKPTDGFSRPITPAVPNTEIKPAVPKAVAPAVPKVAPVKPTDGFSKPIAPTVPREALPTPGELHKPRPHVPSTKPASATRPVAPSVPAVAPKPALPAKAADRVAGTTAKVATKALPKVSTGKTGPTQKPTSLKQKATERAKKRKPTPSIYKEGDHSWKIMEAQKKLVKLGYKPDNTKGDFSKLTAKELKRYQGSHKGKLKKTGKLDEATYQQLVWDVFAKEGNGKAKGKEIVALASRYRGVPYVFGGTTPRGFDCSGYVQYVYRQKGVKLTRTADTQALEGVYISKRSLKPGDLVFFTTYEPGASHVGIYAGNDKFWNATSSRGIMLCELNDSYWGPRYYGARRVLVSNGE